MKNEGLTKSNHKFQMFGIYPWSLTIVIPMLLQLYSESLLYFIYWYIIYLLEDVFTKEDLYHGSEQRTGIRLLS